MNSGFRNRPRIILPTRRVVARFGGARLMREPDGRFALEGGSRHDHLTAIEWTSMFLPEAVVAKRGSTIH